MTEAYVLAGELHAANGDHEAAFRNYETKLMPFLAKKQKMALNSMSFFAPKSRLASIVRNVGIGLSNVPFLAKLLIGASLGDDFELPNYLATESP